MASRAEASSSGRQEALLQAREQLDEAAEVCQAAWNNLDRARRDLRLAAERVGAPAAVDEAERVEDADEAERLVHAWLGAQRGRIEAVRASLDAHERALAERQFRETQVAANEEAVGERANAAAAATAEVQAVLAEYRRAVAEWSAGCVSLGHDRLPDPEAASWRADRTGRLGAPLWRLVDLAGDLGTNDVAAAVVSGLEAALTGAGLLDAWVQPDGSVELAAMGADVVLTARPLADATLSSVLVPAALTTGGERLPVAPEVVASVLSSIALVDSVGGADDVPDVAVARDGTYRLGSAVGRGPTRPARLLGAVARERHRLARLAELDAELAELDARLGAIARREADLDRRRTAVEAELATLPSSAPVHEAEQKAADAAVRVREAEGRLEASRAALRAAEDGVRVALRDLTALGARHGLPTDRPGLAAAEAALARLGEVVAVWARRRREAFALERQRLRARERASKAEQNAARAAHEHADAEREATAIEGRVEALESSVGAEYRDVLVRLSALDEERSGARRRLRELGQRGLVLERRVGEFQSKVETAAAARLEAEAERERAQHRLVAAADELGPDAAISPSDGLESASAALAFARAIASEHPSVDTQPETVERLSERVREAVHQAQTVLGPRVDLDRELGDAGWWVLRTTVGGVHRRAGELSEALAAELAQGREELAADEERLFEQTLAGSVRRALVARSGKRTSLSTTSTSSSPPSARKRPASRCGCGGRSTPSNPTPSRPPARCSCGIPPTSATASGSRC